jgi:hypothetical protein
MVVLIARVGDNVAVEGSGAKVVDRVAAGEREGGGASVGVADAIAAIGLDVRGVGCAVLLAINARVRDRAGVAT